MENENPVSNEKLRELSSSNSSLFTTAVMLNQDGLKHVPECYVQPPAQRPNSIHSTMEAALPVIDLAQYSNDVYPRSKLIDEVRTACTDIGFFQVCIEK